MAKKNLFKEEEFVKDDLRIHTESAYSLEQDLKNHPNLVADYYRWYAQAIVEADQASLDLEVISAEILEEILEGYEKKGKTIPPSAKSEVRKSEVPLDKRYQKAKKNASQAFARKEYLKGLLRSWSDRSHRLTEIVDMMSRQLYYDSPKYTTRNLEKRAEKSIDNMELD